MFRGPHILAWSCPIRSLLLLREPHLSVLSEQTGAAGQFAKHGKESRYSRIAERGRSKEGSSETVPCAVQPSLFSSDCGNHHLGEASLQNHASQDNFSSHRRHHPTLVSTSTKDKQASDPWKYTEVEDSGQIPKAVSTHQDCLTNTTCLQPWRRPWDKGSLTFTQKTQSNPPQSHLYHRLFNLSASTKQTLNRFHSRTQAYSPIFQQIKAIHQAAAPRVVDAWRDCLSPENETRCRQSLGPNLKLYEADRGRKAASQSQGKDQGKWASVLVSLCSVEGQPAFLFTLRSSTLKGRHKGDVSFAGGKSDPSDRDVVDTALREAREELGIHVGTEKVWGVMKPLRDMSGMKIAPVLANLGPIEELSFKPNPGEVEEIFTLTLSHLCNPLNCGYTHFRTGDKYGYTLPVFRNGKHRVWGLTAVALDHTLKLVVPS